MGVSVGIAEERLFLKLRLFFIPITLLPKKAGSAEKKAKKDAKKEEKKKKKKKAPQKESSSKDKKKTSVSPQDAEKKAGNGKKKSDIKKFLPLLKKHLPPLLRCLRISDFTLKWEIQKEDAASTAVTYGAAFSLMAGIITLLEQFSRHLGKVRVELQPKFEGNPSPVYFGTTVSFSPGRLLWRSIALLIDILKHKTH